MPISISDEAYIFLLSVVGGMIIPFIYDLFRIKRKAINTSTLFIYLEDLLFWILVAIVMFAIVYYSNEGEVRGFILFGTILGAILYILLLSKAVVKISITTIQVICKVIKTIFTIITYPIKVAYKILRVPCRFIYKILKKFMRAAKRVGKNNASKFYRNLKILKNVRKKI
ncbi:MAG: spore cortex biosynthesis protein YabQ [Clostridia bacterium]|nr:spore cortex biosynthesis protein YabQ [Clostridia bacterium]